MVKSRVMERIYKTRRARLKQLIKERYEGSNRLFAEAAKEKWTAVCNWVSGLRVFNEWRARRVEEKLGLAPYWFDGIEILRTPRPVGDAQKHSRIADEDLTEAA